MQRKPDDGPKRKDGEERARRDRGLRNAPPLLDRAWGLRSRLNAYDALYVALAVELDCPLVTTDDRIPSPRLPARVLHA